MAMFVKKPETFDCYTYEELTTLGKQDPCAVIKNGDPVRFTFKNFPVTMRDNGDYCITTGYGQQVGVVPGNIVAVSNNDSKLYVYDKDAFDRKFQITFA